MSHDTSSSLYPLAVLAWQKLSVEGSRKELDLRRTLAHATLYDAVQLELAAEEEKWTEANKKVLRARSGDSEESEVLECDSSDSDSSDSDSDDEADYEEDDHRAFVGTAWHAEYLQPTSEMHYDECDEGSCRHASWQLHPHALFTEHEVDAEDEWSDEEEDEDHHIAWRHAVESQLAPPMYSLHKLETPGVTVTLSEIPETESAEAETEEEVDGSLSRTKSSVSLVSLTFKRGIYKALKSVVPPLGRNINVRCTA